MDNVPRRYRVTTHWPAYGYQISPSQRERERGKTGPEIRYAEAREETTLMCAEEVRQWMDSVDSRASVRVETLDESVTERKWEVDKRRRVETYVAEKPQVGELITAPSPSGRWKLAMEHHGDPDGTTWLYTRACVLAADGSEVTTVIRNYGNFHHCWVEDWQSHDYLLCGEDYQGHTVIELDTGKRADYLPPSAKNGGGFCFAEYTLIPERTQIEVLGCYWACPYERVVYDFREPLNLPWRELWRRYAVEDEPDWDDVEQEVRNG